LICESKAESVMKFNLSFAVNTLFRGIPDVDYYIILMGDAYVTSNWLYPLLKTFEQDSTIGIVGPSFVGTNGTKYNAGPELLIKQEDVVFVLGSLQVVSRECAKKIGGWSEEENLKLVFNDAEYCFRAWENGFRVVFQPESIVIHDNSLFMIEALQREGKEVWGNLNKMYRPEIGDSWNIRIANVIKIVEESNKRYEI
jgi:cellulose synthase/poly-beta-1,6-N-acetylglucosamine synthase-like glycosyltransferase